MFYLILILLVILGIGTLLGKGRETLEGIGGILYVIVSLFLSIVFAALPIVVAILILSWIFS